MARHACAHHRIARRRCRAAPSGLSRHGAADPRYSKRAVLLATKATAATVTAPPRAMARMIMKAFSDESEPRSSLTCSARSHPRADSAQAYSVACTIKTAWGPREWIVGWVMGNLPVGGVV